MENRNPDLDQWLEVSRVARFVDDDDFEAKKTSLRKVILAWIQERS